MALSVGNHLADLPDKTHAVKFAAVADSSREGLTDAWKAWIQAAGARVLATQPRRCVAQECMPIMETQPASNL